MGDVPNDLHVTDLIKQMEALLRENPHVQLFVKWTCPNCGQRAMSAEPNVFHAQGYVHEDCGFLYAGDYYGFMAAFTIGKEEEDA